MLNINSEKYIKEIYKILNIDWKKINSDYLNNNRKEILAKIKNESIKKYNLNENFFDYEIEEYKFEYLKNKNSNYEIPLVYNFNKKNKKWIIGVHPYMSSKEYMINFLNFYRAKGFNILSFDLQNHGESKKNYTTFGIEEVNDLISVLIWLNKKFKPKAIGLHGIGMGAYICNRFALMNLFLKYKVIFNISEATYYDYYLFLKKTIYKIAYNKIPDKGADLDKIADDYISYIKIHDNFQPTNIPIQRLIITTNSSCY